MLSGTALKKATASIVVFVFTFLSLTLPSEEIKQIRINCHRPLTLPLSLLTSYFSLLTSSAYAGDFEDTVTSGQSLGSDLLNSYSPQNINQTLQNKGLGTADTITPQASEAETQRGSYEDYYTNPGGMSSANTNTDAGNFLNESYEHREKFDLSSDSTFGNKCLEKDAQGNCIRYSSSADLITNTYTDCTKTTTVHYTGGYEEKTCTTAVDNEVHECRVSAVANVTSEQIPFTVENYSYLNCSNYTPDYVSNQIYLICKDNYYYLKAFNRVNRERDDCVCTNHSGAFCSTPPDFVTYLQNGYYRDLYLGQSYENYRDRDYEDGWDDCTSDVYDWYAVTNSLTVERIILTKDSPCGDNLDKWSNECTVSKLELCNSYGTDCVAVIDDGQVTNNAVPDSYMTSNIVGSLENYALTLNTNTMTLNGTTLTSTSQRSDSATGEYGVTFTWARIYGGPDVPSGITNWYSRVTFKCEGQLSSECQSLVDQGCTFYSSKCLDDGCTQMQRTYRCGTAAVPSDYEVTYNCAGSNIRCMGSDCKDTSYEANQDFAEASTAGEIITMMRSDGTETEIFPGKESICQSSPENCCKPNTGGISILDYVMAAKAAVSLYSTLSAGFSATSAATAASITSAVNSIASYTGLATSVTTTSTATGVTTTMTTTFAGTTATATTTSSIGVTYGSTGAISSSFVSTVATVATVIGIVIAAAAICTLVYNLLFGCDQDDMLTSINLGFNLCHYVGQKCTVRALGVCLQKKKTYCCFNSILARIIHEQGRPQIGRGWGDVDDPDCSGLAPGEINEIDFSKIDLTEYMQYIEQKTNLTDQEKQAIADKVKQKYQ